MILTKMPIDKNNEIFLVENSEQALPIRTFKNQGKRYQRRMKIDSTTFIRLIFSCEVCELILKHQYSYGSYSNMRNIRGQCKYFMIMKH